MKFRCLLIAVCLFLSAVAGFAQSDRGTITGTVSDATGAVIPGVAIEAKNVQTGATYQAGSSETGNYTLAQLPAGTYELSANLPGFKRFQSTNPNLLPDFDQSTLGWAKNYYVNEFPSILGLYSPVRGGFGSAASYPLADPMMVDPESSWMVTLLIMWIDPPAR